MNATTNTPAADVNETGLTEYTLIDRLNLLAAAPRSHVHGTDYVRAVCKHAVRHIAELEAENDLARRTPFDRWRFLAEGHAPNDPPLDVLLAYRDTDTGEPQVAQGCRRPDGRYVLTPEDEHAPVIVEPIAFMFMPPHPELLP